MLHQPHCCSSPQLFSPLLQLHFFTLSVICVFFFTLHTFPVTSVCSQSSQCPKPNPLPPARNFLFSVSAFIDNVALLLLHLSIFHCHFQLLTRLPFYFFLPHTSHLLAIFPLCGSIDLYTNQCNKTTPSAHISIFGTYGYVLNWIYHIYIAWLSDENDIFPL